MLFLLLLYLCSAERLLLTVAYCPSAFTAGGAIVSIDVPSGNWHIVRTFKWPNAIQSEGCGAGVFDTPAFALDKSSTTVYLDFVDAFGVLVSLNLNTAQTGHISPSDDFFTGFWNMAITAPGVITGLYGNVTEGDWCSDGCFALGSMAISSGQFTPLANLPYKAVMDDSHFFDPNTNLFWFQGSYPLESSATCSDTDSDLCLVAASASTGQVAKPPIYTNWTVYRYAPNYNAHGNLLTWMEGFDSLCNNPYDNFLFANVTLNGAKAVPVECIPTSVVDQEDEWIASFSGDSSMLATASGDADAGEAQLLVFNTNTAVPIVNNKLEGLGQALKSFSGLFWVWHVAFVS